MKRFSLMLLSLIFVTGCAPFPPLVSPSGSDPLASRHNADGIAHFNAGSWEFARSAFEHAIKADPALAEAHYNLGLVLDKIGAFDEATMHFRQAEDLAPGNRAITHSEELWRHVYRKRDYDHVYGYRGDLDAVSISPASQALKHP